MKLKCLPADFRVEELTGLKPAETGPFAFYRLTKESLGTIEAVEAVQHRLKIERRRLSYGGLKDRHACTTQFVTIHRGPRRGFEQAHLRLEYLGQTGKPFVPAEIAGNRFQITIRSLSTAKLKDAQTALEAVRTDGLPNYFDDQRFGSVGGSAEFVARPWIRGDYERALWLALADARGEDRAEEKKAKALLREHWGDWKACKAALEAPSHRRSIVTFLCDHPRDYKRAFALIRQDLRSLYLAAFQSHLWNRMLAAHLRELFLPGSLIEIQMKLDPLPFPIHLNPSPPSRPHPHPNPLPPRRERGDPLFGNLPLPSARLKPEPGPVADLLDKTLAAEGLVLREIRVKYPRDSFFSKGTRPALLIPRDLTWEEAADELHSGRRKLLLRFDLPRGSYATILIKRVFQGDAQPAHE